MKAIINERDTRLNTMDIETKDLFQKLDMKIIDQALSQKRKSNIEVSKELRKQTTENRRSKLITKTNRK